MEHIYLQGSEAVQNAATSIRSSAELMQRAALEIAGAVQTLEYVLQRHQEFMNQWLERMEQAKNGT